MKRQFEIKISAQIILNTHLHEYQAIMEHTFFGNEHFLTLMNSKGETETVHYTHYPNLIHYPVATCPHSTLIKPLLSILDNNQSIHAPSYFINKFNLSFRTP